MMDFGKLKIKDVQKLLRQIPKDTPLNDLGLPAGINPFAGQSLGGDETNAPVSSPLLREVPKGIPLDPVTGLPVSNIQPGGSSALPIIGGQTAPIAEYQPQSIDLRTVQPGISANGTLPPNAMQNGVPAATANALPTLGLNQNQLGGLNQTIPAKLEPNQDNGFNRMMRDVPGEIIPVQNEQNPIAAADAMAAAVNQPRTSAVIQSEIAALKQNGVEREDSFWKRLGGGFLDAYINWGKSGGQGGIAGLLGQLAVGGGGSAASPGFRAEWKQNNQDQKLMRELTEAQKNEDFALKQQAGKTQIENSDARIRQGDERIKTANQKLVNSEYDTGFKQAMAKLKLGYKRGENPALDEELKRYGIDVEQYDTNNRTFWQGQNQMTFNERGEAVPVLKSDGTPVTDMTRAPVTVEYDGQKFTVSNTVAFQGVTNAGRTNTGIGNQNIQDDNEYRDTLTKWEGSIAEKDAIITKNSPVINGNEAKIEEIKNNPANKDKNGNLSSDSQKDIDRLESQNLQLQGENSAAQKERDRLKSNPPVKPQPRQQTTVPTTGGKYANQVFLSPQSLKSYFPGKEDAEIRKIVKAQGGTFQQ